MNTTNALNRVIFAKPLQDHVVELHFSDGFIGQVDLTSQLWGKIFEALRDPAEFARLRVEDHTIRWPNGADFCPNVLRFWCEIGHVATQAETDAHFESSHESRPAATR